MEIERDAGHAKRADIDIAKRKDVTMELLSIAFSSLRMLGFAWTWCPRTRTMSTHPWLKRGH